MKVSHEWPENVSLFVQVARIQAASMDTTLPTRLAAQRVPSIVLKVVMAITGALMALWLTLHAIGNLTVFGGAALINGYGAKLRDSGLLWPMRVGLIAALASHVLCAVLTSQRAWRARPQRYAQSGRLRASTRAGLSMRLTGGLLLAYLGYHVTRMYGLGQHAYAPGDAHHSLVDTLQQPLHAALHLLATALITLHLAHGLGSALITLGYVARQRERLLKRALAVWAWTVTASFAAEVLAPLFGLIA